MPKRHGSTTPVCGSGPTSNCPLTILTIANLWAAWRYTAGWLRAWWISASIVSLAERVLTLAYFIPTMIGLMNAPDTAESVATAARWVEVNYIRHAMALAAWLLALQTFWMWPRHVTSVTMTLATRARPTLHGAS